MRAIEKLAVEHDALLASYRGLLAAVARGERVEADLQADSWRVLPALPPAAVGECRGMAVTMEQLRAGLNGEEG